MLKAIGDTIIVKKIYQEKSSSIVIPDKAQKFKQYDGKVEYEIISVGPDYPYNLKKGDKIIMQRHEGIKFKIKGEEYFKVRERWVHAKLL